MPEAVEPVYHCHIRGHYVVRLDEWIRKEESELTIPIPDPPTRTLNLLERLTSLCIKDVMFRLSIHRRLLRRRIQQGRLYLQSQSVSVYRHPTIVKWNR